jgi:stage V sporulation protein R
MARHGQSQVEDFIDVCLSIENLIDPMSLFINRTPKDKSGEAAEEPQETPRLAAKEYMEDYINPPEFMESQRQKQEEIDDAQGRFPEEPQRDVLKFLLQYAPLEDWERDCLEVIRSEAYYYAPQAMTKIMNEGWATYWHSKILTSKALKGSEVVDYADACAGVLATAPGRLNPYKLGVELLRHIEMRWNKGQFGKEWDECDTMAAKFSWDRRLGLGREKIFEVRKLYNDITFIDEFFTLEFCIEQKFYAFGFNDRSSSWEIMSRDFEQVKKQLLDSLTNRGQPVIRVVDANFQNAGELLLRHEHEGIDLDMNHGRDTLENLHKIWKRPVNIYTVVEEKGKLLRFGPDGYSDKVAEPTEFE